MVITGIIRELDTIETLKGNTMAIASLKRNKTQYSLIFFPTAWKEGCSNIKNGDYVSLEVKPDKHSGEISYIVQRVIVNE